MAVLSMCVVALHMSVATPFFFLLSIICSGFPPLFLGAFVMCGLPVIFVLLPASTCPPLPSPTSLSVTIALSLFQAQFHCVRP